MQVVYLVKPGELTLKGENRRFFESVLARNIRRRLAGIPHVLRNNHGRLILTAGADAVGRIEEVLATTIGLAGWARTEAGEKSLDGIQEAAFRAVRGAMDAGAGSRFKVEARREDKGFPIDSYEICRRLGDLLRERFPGLSVRLAEPDWVLNVEVRDRVYVYVYAEKGERGLPVGANGRGLLLLSGGIDSPVAGYLMAKRGLGLDAVYFHSYPYTGKEAQDKVVTLASTLVKWTGKIRLFIAPFTDVLLKIKETAPAEEMTLLSRAAMMRVAHCLAKRRRDNCIVTGESLGQVASQTAEAIRFTGSLTDLPVFRPLIGLDKESIVHMARHVGSYETSVLPYQDCCVLFSPKHPLIRPDFRRMHERFLSLNIEPDLKSLAGACVWRDFDELVPRAEIAD